MLFSLKLINHLIKCLDIDPSFFDFLHKKIEKKWINEIRQDPEKAFNLGLEISNGR